MRGGRPFPPECGPTTWRESTSGVRANASLELEVEVGRGSEARSHIQRDQAVSEINPRTYGSSREQPAAGQCTRQGVGAQLWATALRRHIHAREFGALPLRVNQAADGEAVPSKQQSAGAD